MGLLDLLTSTKRPAPGVAPRAPADVRGAILALNRPTAPYRITDGAEEHVDLIAEWKIVDAAWYETFGKAGLRKTFRIYLKLDPAGHTVRASDRAYAVEWSAGVPRLSLVADGFRGQKHAVEFGTAYAMTEEVRPGEVYRYRFSTRELKGPIQDAVTGCGWTYRGVAFRRL